MQKVVRVVLAVSVMALAGCERIGGVAARVQDRFDGDETQMPVADAADGAVDAPDVSGRAQWDGVPSLGGIWIAHPDVGDPLRVRISRSEGGRSVDGWLFGRDAAGDGPELQVSSEAAAVLGMAAGEVAELTVSPLADAVPGQAG